MLRFCPEAQGIWRFQLIFVGTEQLVPWLHSIVHCSKLPYIVHCQWWTLFSVFWHFCSTPHATRQLLRLRVCCAKLVTLSDHMEHSSRGDLHLLFSFIFLACRNCPRGAIQAQEEVLDPCCEPYAQPSPSLTFFSGPNKAWDSMSNSSLQVICNKKLTLGQTSEEGWMPPPKVFLSFFLEDKTSAPDVFSSYSFIPCAHFNLSSVIISFYGYEIWGHKEQVVKRFSMESTCFFSAFFNNKSKSWG